MHTSLYRLDTTKFQWDAAHLFEHIIIRGFYVFAEKNNFHPGIIGWVNGDTFDDCIYLDAGFYDEAVLKLFQRYITSLPLFSKADIKLSSEIVAAEERSDIELLPGSETVLNQLHDLVWTKGEGESSVRGKKPTPKTVIKLKRHAASFRDITFEIYAENVTPDEAKVFQRYTVILQDILFSGLVNHNPVYFRGSSRLFDYDKGLKSIFLLTVRRGHHNLKGYERLATEALESFDVTKNYAAIKKHMDTVAAEPWLTSIPIEYYRNSLVVTTTKEITRLASLELLLSLSKKLRLSTRAADSNDQTLIL